MSPLALTTAVPVELYGATWTPVRLMHGRLPIHGFRVDHGDASLAYCTDVSRIPPESYPLLRDLDVLVIDGLRPRHHPTHLSTDQALDVIAELKPKQAFLTHLAHDESRTSAPAYRPRVAGLRRAHRYPATLCCMCPHARDRLASSLASDLHRVFGVRLATQRLAMRRGVLPRDAQRTIRPSPQRNSPMYHPLRVPSLIGGLLLAAALHAPHARPKAAPHPQVATPHHGADEQGFVPLFDGRTLEGWTAARSKAEGDWGAFSVNHEEQAIHVYAGEEADSEQITDCLNTTTEFSHYILRLEYKWMGKRFAPRTDWDRDAGLLFHVHGSTTRVWPYSLEMQIGESPADKPRSKGSAGRFHSGDLFVLGKHLRTDTPIRNKYYAHDGKLKTGRSVPTPLGTENPRGEWNQMEIRVHGSEKAVFVFNGQIVLETRNFTQSKDGQVRPLEPRPARWVRTALPHIRIKERRRSKPTVSRFKGLVTARALTPEIASRNEAPPWPLRFTSPRPINVRQRRPLVPLPHQVLAHQHAVHARVGQPLDVGPRADARFADQDRLVGHLAQQVQGVLHVGGHGPQVAVVDAQQLVARVGKPTWLRTWMRLS